MCAPRIYLPEIPRAILIPSPANRAPIRSGNSDLSIFHILSGVFLQANVLGMTLNPSHTSDLGSPCHSWYHVAMHSDALISCPCSRSVQTQICAYGRKGPWTHGVNSARQLGLQCHHLRGASAYGRQRPAWQAHAKATRQVYQCSATNYSTEAMWMAALARMI